MESRTPVLIGVGGTGQNVVAAYLRLAQMAGFEAARFFIVDSDARGPQFNGLTQLAASSEMATTSQDRWHINPYPSDRADRRRFGALFGSLDGDQRQLFETLFSADAERTEIRTGMYGRPAIGATCMRLKFLREDKDIKELWDALQGAPKHVILVGSCFGGTGSGGVPMLARELARRHQMPGYDLRVDAMVFLPWFRLVSPPGGPREDDQSLRERLNDNFQPNAAASIRYFGTVLEELVKTLIFLGVPDPSGIVRESNESQQGETVHVLNLLAALLVHNHFQAPDESPRRAAGFWYDGERGLDPVDLILRRLDSQAVSLVTVMRRTSAEIHWMDHLATLLTNYEALPKLFRPPFLEGALRRMTGPGSKRSEVLARCVEELGERRDHAQRHLQWMESMADDGLFPLEPGDKQILSEEYQKDRQQPLRVFADWSRNGDLADEFERKDLERPALFTRKLAHLFLDELNRRYRL